MMKVYAIYCDLYFTFHHRHEECYDNICAWTKETIGEALKRAFCSCFMQRYLKGRLPKNCCARIFYAGTHENDIVKSIFGKTDSFIEFHHKFSM